MPPDRATILQRNNNDLMRPYRQKLDTPFLNQDNEILRKMQERGDAFGVKEDNILSNRSLSSEGKQRALAALVNDSLESFGSLTRVTGDLEGEATATRATVFAIKPPSTWGTDPVLKYLRGKEIRDQFRGLHQPEQDSRFIRAAETDGDEVLWAMLEAPGEPMVSEEVKGRALEERAKRLHPQAFHRLGQLTTLAEELGGLRDHVVLWLQGLGGDPKKIYDALGGPEPTPQQRAARMVAA